MDYDRSTYDPHEWECDSLSELREQFKWTIPKTLNAADVLCDSWADADDERIALYYEDRTQDREGTLTFTELRDESARLAGYLRERGVAAGDFVAVNLPRKPETLVTHLAIWRLGAVSAPLSILFGPDGLEFRLSDCDPTVAVVDSANLENFRAASERTGGTDDRIIVGDADLVGEEIAYRDAVELGEPVTEVAETAVDDPMLLMYSSGTTGRPKGIVQPHRAVLGHLPGTVTNFYNLDVRDDEIWWTPSEWAWGAFLSLLIDAFYFGRPIVAVETGEGFDPELALDVLQRYDVTHAFIPPSALRMLRTSDVVETCRSFPELRLVTTGGESLDARSQEWAESYLDTIVHETYGSTEMFNHIIGDCTALEPADSEHMGYALPGHKIELLDPESGEPVPAGEPGEVALHRDDPVLFEGYLGRPEATDDAYRGDWYLSGDIAIRNEEGQFRFVSRRDDLIISAGYRIGPDEIEDVLAGHNAVAAAGVVGVPDEERGQVPKAYVVLASGHVASDDLREELRQYVRETLAAYEYPRELAFVESLPRTTTGKVKRSALDGTGGESNV
jgi:acetyl-CoA synthetase